MHSDTDLRRVVAIRRADRADRVLAVRRVAHLPEPIRSAYVDAPHLMKPLTTPIRYSSVRSAALTSGARSLASRSTASG